MDIYLGEWDSNEWEKLWCCVGGGSEALKFAIKRVDEAQISTVKR